MWTSVHCLTQSCCCAKAPVTRLGIAINPGGILICLPCRRKPGQLSNFGLETKVMSPIKMHTLRPIVIKARKAFNRKRQDEFLSDMLKRPRSFWREEYGICGMVLCVWVGAGWNCSWSVGMWFSTLSVEPRYVAAAHWWLELSILACLHASTRGSECGKCFPLSQRILRKSQPI